MPEPTNLSPDQVAALLLLPRLGTPVFPSGGDDTTALQSALDAAQAAAVPGRVQLVDGTYNVSSLNWPPEVDIVGVGVNRTRIKMLPGANASAVMQTMGFAALDAAAEAGGLFGTGPTGGAFRNTICDLTIDGNREHNTSGRGLQIYGKAYNVERVAIENTAGDGLYTNYNGPDNFSTPAGTLEALYDRITIQNCGGSGWIHRGPHDSFIRGGVIFLCSGNGWEVRCSTHAHGVNTYLVDNIGIWVQGSPDGLPSAQVGCIYGTNITGCGTVCGGRFDAEGSVISSSSWGGGQVGLEVRSNETMIHGLIANSPTVAFRLNGIIAAGRFDLVLGGGNSGIWIDNGPTISTVPSMISLTTGQEDGPLFNSGVSPIPYGVTNVVAIGKTGTYTR